MAEQYNVMQTLFGFTPQNVQQSLDQQANQRAMEIAKMGGQGAGSAGVYYALSGLERAGTRPLLGVSPQVQQATNMQNIIQQVQAGGVDLSSPDGQIALAQELSKYPEFIGMATALRQQASTSSIERQKAEAGIDVQRAQAAEIKARTGKIEFASQQEEKLRQEIANLPPGASEEQILGVYRRYGSADQQSRAIQASLDRRARLAADKVAAQPELNNNGVPQGRVDAKGNFFDNSGRKVASKEFVDAEQSHNTALDLLSRLREINEKDINAAFGSVADYTQSDTGKLVGRVLSSETQKAQYKINQVGVTAILENLQKLKGASTDKEMQKVSSTFPGYQAKPEVMKAWIDSAIEATNNFLKRSEKRYGFDTTYEQENRFGTKQPRQPKANEIPNISDDALIQKYLKR
jgi:hypothetical protein